MVFPKGRYADKAVFAEVVGLSLLAPCRFRLRRQRGNSWELTPRGTRKIGQAALGEIYAQLKKESLGKHRIADSGQGTDRAALIRRASVRCNYLCCRELHVFDDSLSAP